MKYLQIWLGKNPTQKIVNCMTSVVDKLTSDDIYILISNNNFLNNKNIIWINSNDYIKEIRKDKNIDLIWNNITKDNKFYCHQSDIIRFHYLSKNDNVLYIDCDVILLDTFSFNENTIYLPTTSNKNKFFDYYLMYGYKEYFKHILTHAIDLFKDIPYLPSSWVLMVINRKTMVDKYNYKPIENKYNHKDL